MSDHLGPFEIQEKSHMLLQKIVNYNVNIDFQSDTEKQMRKIIATTFLCQIDADGRSEHFDFDSQNCKGLSIVRSLAMTVGKTLKSINLSSCVNLNDEMVETFCSHIEGLKQMDLGSCMNISDRSCRSIARFCGKTLLHLNLSCCEKITSESCGWLAGKIGQHSPHLRKIQYLDLSGCPNIDDRALRHISSSFGKLIYFNLTKCDKITSKGVGYIANGCHRLKVLHLRDCKLIDNVGIVKLAKGCNHLLSLNLSSIGPISNQAVNAISRYCPKIQTLSIEGARRVNEKGLCQIAKMCKDIVMLNITGCNVTRNALLALAKGISYVEEAKTFFGLMPLSEATDLKLKDQMDFLVHKSAIVIQTRARLHLSHVKEEKMAKFIMMDKSALDIQLFFQRRMQSRLKRQRKLRHSNAIFIQKNYRMWVCRRRMKAHVSNKLRMAHNLVFIILIQKIYRGYLTRLSHEYVKNTIVHLRRCRLEDKLNKMAIRLQCLFRQKASRFVLREKLLSWNRKVLYIIKLQAMVRTKVARNRLQLLQHEHHKQKSKRLQAVISVQCWHRVCVSKKMLVIYRNESHERELERLQKIIIVQSIIRKSLAVNLLSLLKQDAKEKHYASVKIQKCFRGSRILHWKYIKFNQIAWFVHKRAEMEFKSSRSRSIVMRHHNKFCYDSDSSVEGANDIYIQDSQNSLGFELSLIGITVQIFWPLSKQYYRGIVTKYNKRKKMWQVRYDDDDIEWIDFRKNDDRVNVYTDGSWKCFGMYSPPDLKIREEKRRLEIEKFHQSEQEKEVALSWTQMGYDHKKKMWKFYNSVLDKIAFKSDNKLFNEWIVIDGSIDNQWYYQNTATGEFIDWNEADPRSFVFDSEDSQDLRDKKNKALANLRYYAYICQGSMEDYLKSRSLKELQSFVRKGFIRKLAACIKQARCLWKNEDFENDKELKYFTVLQKELNSLSCSLLEDDVI